MRPQGNPGRPTASCAITITAAITCHTQVVELLRPSVSSPVIRTMISHSAIKPWLQCTPKHATTGDQGFLLGHALTTWRASSGHTSAQLDPPTRKEPLLFVFRPHDLLGCLLPRWDGVTIPMHR
jgi:hypothetical protein